MIVCPYVKPGAIFRSPTSVPFDHTSVIATLRKRFDLKSLTARDEKAPDLDSVLVLPTPDNRGPPRVKALLYTPTPQTAALAQTKPLNSMQRALVGAAANLPEVPGKDMNLHRAEVKAGLKPPPPEATVNVQTARTFVKKQVGNLVQGASRK